MTTSAASSDGFRTCEGSQFVSTTTERWPAGDDRIELAVLIRRLWHRRWWIVASVLVCGAIGAAIALLSTPIFRATVVMVPANTEGRDGLEGALGQIGGLASLAGLSLGSQGNDKEEALAVLRSREFTERFIHDRNLMPILFATRWDAKEQRWRPGAKPPTPAQGYKYFHGQVRSIVQDKKTGLVTVHVDWKDGALAAQWANELVARLNTEMRTRAIAHADASVGYLERELENTNVVTTREAINRLIESQIKSRMLANVTQEYAFRVVDPALAPDADDPLWPNKPLLLAAGLLLGGVLGMLIVWVAGMVSAGRYTVRDGAA
jgi:uncharacterized protein involved in exopolysaccharide biosynthesis